MLNIFITLVAVFPFPFLMPSTLVVISSSWTEFPRGTVLLSYLLFLLPHLSTSPLPPILLFSCFLTLVFPSSYCSGLIHLLLIIVFTNPLCWLCWFFCLFFNRKGYLWKRLTAWVATLKAKSAITELCECIR